MNPRSTECRPLPSGPTHRRPTIPSFLESLNEGGRGDELIGTGNPILPSRKSKSHLSVRNGVFETALFLRPPRVTLMACEPKTSRPTRHTRSTSGYPRWLRLLREPLERGGRALPGLFLTRPRALTRKLGI